MALTTAQLKAKNNSLIRLKAQPKTLSPANISEVIDDVIDRTENIFVALSGTAWNVINTPNVYKAFTPGLNITFTGVPVAGLTRIEIIITDTDGTDITINGVTFPTKAGGDTRIEAIYIAANRWFYSCDAGSGSTTIGGSNLTPLLADYFYNTRELTYGSNKRYNAFATLKYNVTGVTSITLRLLSTVVTEGGSYNAAEVAVYLDSTLLQTCAVTTDNVAQDFTISIPGNGVLNIVTGSQSRANDSGNIKGTTPVLVTFTGGTATKVSVTKQTKSVVTITDSIGVGVGTTLPEQKAYPVLWRTAHTDTDFYVLGYGAKQAAIAFADSTEISSVITELHTALDGYTEQTVYIALGINDVNNGISPAFAATAINNAVTAIKAAFSTAKVVVQTPTITSTGEGIASTKQLMRDAIGLLASPHKIVHGHGILSAANLHADGIHVNNAGNVQMAANIWNIIYPTATSYTLIEDKIFTDTTGWSTSVTGPNSITTATDGGVTKQEIISTNGSYDANIYKHGLFTAGDVLKITIDCRTVSGKLGFVVGSFSVIDFVAALRDGINTFIVDTTGYADTYILIGNNGGIVDAYLREIKVEKL